MLAGSALVAGCQTDGSAPPKLSLDAAKQVTATFEGSSFTPPPRTIADIAALLDRHPQRETTETAKLRQTADSPPPETSDARKLAEFYHQRAMAAKELGRSRQLLDDLRLALAQVEQHGVTGKTRARVLHRIAWAEYETGSAAQGLAYMERALQVAPGAGWLVAFHSALAVMRAWSGEIETAEQHLKEARKHHGATRALKGVASRHRSAWTTNVNWAAAAILEARGSYLKAEPFNRSAIDALAGDAYWRESDLSRILRSRRGRILRKQGRLSEAEAVLREVLVEAIEKRGRYSSHTGWRIQFLFRAVADQGRYRDAEFLARSMLDIFERLNPTGMGVAFARLNLSELTAARADWSSTTSLYEQLRAQLRSEPETYTKWFADSPSYPLALIKTGRGREALNYLATAHDRLSSRLGAKHYKSAEVLALRAMARAELGQTTEALEDFAVAMPILLSNSRQSLANEQMAKTRDDRLRWIVEGYVALLANIWAKDEGSDAAANAFRIAQVAAGRSVQRALLASSARVAVRDPALADLARREQDARKQIAALYGLLSKIVAVPEEERNPDAITDVRVRIDKLHGAWAVLMEEIEARFPDYARLVDPKPATIEQARASLRPGEALIAIYVAEDATYVWAVPKKGTVAFAAVPLGHDRMEAVVTDLRRALDPRAATLGDIPDFDVALSHRLYRSLFEPVKDGWREAKSLLVVAHGALGQLPLSLLVTAPPRLAPAREPLFARYKEVPWLARSHAVTTLPSVASLTALRRLPTGNASRRAFLGFGDPWFSQSQAAAAVTETATETAALTSRGILAVRGLPVRLRSLPKMDGFDSAELARLPRLPDTRDEVRSMALAMNADLTRDVFTGKEANEDRVKSMELSGYKVLAFATHGLVPGDLDGLTQPALALTAPAVAGVAGDGLLTMGEILGLRLDADWVVLSACNTASGDGAGAEAVSGLGRAFFYAGTRALLVSNWPVETTSAKALTTDLFRRQAEGAALSRAEALRQARVALIDGPGYVDAASGKIVFSYAHPIFWAPFTLIGDGGGNTPGA